MDNVTAATILQAVSIATAGLTMGLGALGPALGEGRAVSSALDAIARQPDMAGILQRNMFVGLAMIESTAIYALVIALILLFGNPLVGVAT
ncbi:MAG: F0F1 ATP synthase subunit C [Planctomycetota bacterium]|jgi:F-type H+-transporting ATPase subunit c